MSEHYDFENTPAEQMKKIRRKPRSKAGLLVILIVICLLAGVALAAWVSSLVRGDARPVQATPSPTVSDEAQAEEASEPEVILGGEAPSISQANNPVVEIAESMGPAVVGVRTSVPEFEVGRPLQEVDYAYGSGFIVSDDGYIVTNHHVIEDAERYTIIMSDGSEYQAELIGSDSYSDIAVLKIDVNRTDLTVSPIGNSDAVRVGELAVAIGSPLGEYLSNTVTVGYISAVNREVDGSTYLQTDAAINPGNSGGPLMNSQGEVIGINALKSYLAGFDEYGIPIATEGIGFAIPINDAMEVVEKIIATGWVQRPGIAIVYYPMTRDDAYIWDVPYGGLVEEVTPGGPADIAGIEVNDIIIAVNGKELTDPDMLPDIIQDYGVGTTVTLTIWRETKQEEIDVSVTIGDLNEMN